MDGGVAGNLDVRGVGGRAEAVEGVDELDEIGAWEDVELGGEEEAKLGEVDVRRILSEATGNTTVKFEINLENMQAQV
ncbi:hypothetical protein CFC21_085241 [Triticum aestivum]|uniref:Uncharacterized protein n=3 Tax=Triticum TaxID=4564 RepID=A0A9R1B4K3_TRITD|nr:hypothetical protein CFC21_085241 [Triticum aestivum]VAI51285.1 unnamed protein product [Triticum turgidum subsp. durum]